MRVIWDQPASRTRRMGPPNTDRRSSQFAILFSDISKVPEILQLHANERHQSEAGIQYSFNQKECYRASAFPYICHFSFGIPFQYYHKDYTTIAELNMNLVRIRFFVFHLFLLASPRETLT